MWFLQNCSKGVHINGTILKAKAVKYNKLLGRHENISKLLKGCFTGRRFDMGYAKLTLKMNLHLVKVQ
jgi:hypothetical protein